MEEKIRLLFKIEFIIPIDGQPLKLLLSDFIDQFYLY